MSKFIELKITRRRVGGLVASLVDGDGSVRWSGSVGSVGSVLFERSSSGSVNQISQFELPNAFSKRSIRD